MSVPPQYINFARKYRPANFHELLGQEALVKILNYSIINNKLSQSYLLTGIRGVGKTTSARIIAKTINCSAAIIQNSFIVACDECANCKSFNQQRHPDVIEIDAASRTGVDDIRDVIESSEYRPLVGKYKIFIIDEVHMLSKSAFNALLKILEEPPPHVIFIFATTEVQKIPSTVISRCQKYDLRRLTVDEVIQLLEKIVACESLKFESSALKLIAIKSEGSARDAVRLLDQASSLESGDISKTISAALVNQMIGSVDTRLIIQLLQYIINQEGAKALELTNIAYGKSSNVENFLQDIANFIAYLSKAKIMINYQEPLYQPFNKVIADILISTNLSKLSILWQIFSQSLLEIKTSYNQLISLEMIIIKALYSYSFPDPETLVTTQNEVEVLNIEPEVSASSVQVLEVADKVVEAKTNENIQIIDFLDFLHKNNQLEIYYLLLNSVEIKEFKMGAIELISESINNKLKDSLKDLLLNWTGTEWNISIIKNQEQTTLKEQMLSQVHSGDNWSMIKKHFPSAKISDLLLNN